MKKIILALFILVILVVAAGAYFFATYGERKIHFPASAGNTDYFEIQRGATARTVANRLHQRQFIAHPQVFYWYSRVHGLTSVRSGVYEPTPGIGVREFLERINRGEVATRSMTVVEGSNRWVLRDQFAAQGWMAKDTFDELCDSQEFLRAHDIPGPTCEGYLYPETYRFAFGLGPKEIFGAMFKMHHDNYKSVVQALGDGPLDLNHRKFVTLASIVEKETGAPKERPRIACVFYNRLKAKPVWRLQTDPTVIYAATLEDPDFDGNIKRSHLHDNKNPYNTYTNYGLPPGPIANPGRAALEAIAKPAKCADFFFVSKNNGEHIFCPTLACHESAVHKWQVRYFRKKR